MSFDILLILYMILNAPLIGYFFWLTLFHEFEQLRSLHKCVHREKISAAAGPELGTLGSESTPLPQTELF